MPTKCFLISETGHFYMTLRRFYNSLKPENKCPIHGYHDARKPLDILGTHEKGTSIPCDMDNYYTELYKQDFPTHCDCGYAFEAGDAMQIFREGQYQDEQGNLYTLRNAPAGAIWEAWWHRSEGMQGPDGKSYVCKLPDGYEWSMDSRASNCDSPCKHCGIPHKDHSINDTSGHYYEDARPHKCWVRHGEPPNLTVDKNGVTCGAGAGSIASKGYHGFLQNGYLT